MNTYDVAVIGGGVHGASAAYHLALAGARTVVFEKDRVASGPTGRSSGCVRGYYTNRYLATVVRESVDFFATFAERTEGGDAGFVRTGQLVLHSEEEASIVPATVRQLNEVGTCTELLTLDQLSDLYPRVVCDGVGIGVWEPGAGYADPAGTAQGLMDFAVRHNVILREHTTVTQIKEVGNRIEVVTNTDERFRAEKLLIAAGPWTKPLAQMVGVDLPLTVERHVVATYAWAGAERLPFVLVDIPNGYYAKPEGSEQFFLGTLHPAATCDPDTADGDITDDESAVLVSQLLDRIPSLEESEARGGWAGLYDVSPDWQPIVGEINDNVFVDCGTSGHGFKMAPIIGRHIVELMSNAGGAEGIEQFHPSRFDDMDHADAARPVQILGYR